MPCDTQLCYALREVKDSDHPDRVETRVAFRFPVAVVSEHHSVKRQLTLRCTTLVAYPPPYILYCDTYRIASFFFGSSVYSSPALYCD